MRRAARIATALGVVGALVALIVPASAGAAFGPAGGWGGSGSGAGQFSSPHGVATDSSGNVYVADTGNERVQAFSSAGAFAGAFTTSLNPSFEPKDVDFVSGVGGNIYTAGPGGVDVINTLLPLLNAHWNLPGANAPYGIAVSGGNIYVSDQGSTVLRKYTAPATEAGAPWPVSLPGVPYGVTTNAAGDVYVALPGVGKVQRYDSGGALQQEWTMPSYTIGSIQGRVDPRDVAVDGTGRVFVPDAGTNSNLTAIFAPNGPLQQIFGTPDGSPTNACSLDAPRGVAFSPLGALYLGDTGSNSIKVFTENAPAGPCPTPSLSSISEPPTENPGLSTAFGPDQAPPTISFSGLPRKKKCARRTFVITIQLRDDRLIDRFTLFLNKRQAATDQVGQPTWLLRVTMPVNKVRRQIPKGIRYPIKLTIHASDTAGNKTIANRKFRICGAGRR